MKKLNLIERLWTDSHEKQSPQRFGRYAVMLIMLLTLGVGQMWAYVIIRNAELAGSTGAWSNSETMTQVGSTNVYYKTYNSPTATTDLIFRIGTGSGWTTAKGDAGIDNKNSNIVMVATGSDENIKFQVPTSVPVTIYYNNSTNKIWIKVASYKTDVLDGKEMFYYGFTNNWSETMAYFYDNGTKKFGSYAANSYANNSAKLAIGVYDVNSSTKYSASNNSSWKGIEHTGMAGGDQIQTYNDGGDKCYHNAADQFSFGTTAYTIVVGQTIASFPTISFTSKQSGADADLSLEGYYYSTATSGQTWTAFTPGTTESSLAAGTYYIKALATDGAIYMASSNYITLTVNSAPVLGVANATSVSNNSATFNATVTLNSNTTTSYGFKYGAGSSYDTKAELVSGGTSASTSGALAGTSFSKDVTGLSASTTYYYISYAVVNGTTYYSSSVKSFTTSANPTYSLTVSAGTGISDVTGSTDDISASQNINITATVATGYTWNTWTKTGTGTLSTFTAGTKNQTVTVGTVGNMTLTASATETKSTITVTANNTSAGSLKFGETSKSWGQTPSLGVVTTQAITATASSGYVFCNWSLSGAAASASDLTSATITLKADGSGNTGTATAMFYEDYYYRGGKNEWGATKMTPHPCGYYAYYTATTGSHDFKICPNSGNYTGACNSFDNDFGNITLTNVDDGFGGLNVRCPGASAHYICVLYPNTAINESANPVIFASTTLPALVPETTYSTTFYAGGHGSINIRSVDIAANGSSSIKIGATARTLTATPASGYSFDKWVTTGSVTVADVYSESTTVTASAAGGTVTATYLANSGWYMHGVVDGVTDWCAASYWPHRWPIDRPYRGVSGVYYRRISSILNGGCFGIHDGSNKYSGDATSSDYSYNGSYHDLVVNSSKCFKASAAFSNKWVVINTASSPKKIWIQSAETCHTVSISNDGNGTKGTVVLKTNDHGNLATNQYTNGETIRVEIDTMAHYSIASVTLGSTPVSMSHSSGTKFTGTAVMPNSDATLTVTYTPWYQVQLEVGTVKGNANTPKIYLGSTSSEDNVISSGSYVISGSTVIFWVANSAASAAKAGYNWWGFRDAPAGTNESRWTNNSVSTYTIPSIAADAHIYAVFGENDYTVTVQSSDATYGGTVASSSVTGHVATKVTLPTATAKAGYYFVNWTTDAGTLTNETSASACQINGLTDGATVTANFAPIWTIAGGDAANVDPDDALGNWNANTNTLWHTYVDATVNYAYFDITTLLPNMDYEFKVVQRSTGDYVWWGAKTVAEEAINYSNSNTRLNIAGGAGNNFSLHTAGAGTYTFDINLDDDKHPIKVHYPTSYTVTFGYGTGGSEVTATVEDATAITSEQYAASGKDITFTQEASTGYTFKGWYDASSGGSAIACMSKSDYVYDDIAGNIAVYAQYTANTYAVTFNATTNGGTLSGSSPKDVTFDATSLASCPVGQKDGYIFDGWYTAATSGKKVINPDGSFVANVTDGTQYTGAGGAWKKAAACTVYAVYVAPDTLLLQKPRVDGKRVPIDTLDAKNHPEIDSVIVHHHFAPSAPYGNYNITYTLCYSNHTPLDRQPTIHYGTGAGVGYDTVWMPMDEIQVYELVATLRTGSTLGAGDLVTTDTALVSVEKTWPVKVRYIMDGVDLRDATEWPVYPSVRTTEVRIPKENCGYELDHLEYGVGVTSDSAKYINEGATYATYVKAANAATITAYYRVPANTIYVKELDADGHYFMSFYVYEYGSDGYWTTGKGSGSNGVAAATRSEHVYNVDGVSMHTISGSSSKMSLTDVPMDDFENFQTFLYDPGYEIDPYMCTPDVIYRTDYNSALPMFVPVAKDYQDTYILNQNGEKTKEARYYRGFWMRYSPDPDSTGYFLKVYDQKEVEGAKLIQSIPMRLTKTGADGTLELTATMDLEGGKTYGFKYTKATGASTVDWYGESGTMTSTNHTDWLFTTGTNNCGLTTTSAGDYTFHLHCVNYGAKDPNAASATDVQGKMVMTVDYATLDGDYRVVYQDDSQLDLTDGVGVEPIASQSMRARANGQDTVTFYIRKDATGRSMKFQKFNGSTGAWDDIAGGTIALTNTADQTFTVSKDTIYQIYLQQNADGTAIGATGMDYYSGSYYIRTDYVDEHKWDYKQSMDAHRMVESDYASHLATDPFTHYFVSWVNKGGNVKYVVATQYSPCLTDTLITDSYANVAGGNLPSGYGANVRYMYNKKTNSIKRAYLQGSEEDDPDYLKLTQTSSGKMKKKDGSSNIDFITFDDLGNWTYQAEIKAQPGLTGKLTAEYDGKTQYFKGSAESSETILGGTGESWQNIIMTYDFKTNRLICAWTPGDTIDATMSINADVMIIRRGQRDAEQIVFKTNETKLTDVKYIYGVIELNYSDLVGMMYSWNYWSYEHCVYYISFPFDVLVNDITGVGKIGVDWRIQRYNGAKRAETGWFIDGEKTFWEDVHAGDTLHAYEGYNLMLARTRFNDSSNDIWKNKTYGDKVYLFFPSLNATTGIIADGEVTFTVPAHECTKDQTFINSYGIQVNHKVTDSHWNMIGTPLFENKTAFSIATGPTIEGQTLQYLYAWNSAGNTLGIQLTLSDTWKFKTMYGYMVQYTGEVTFKGSTVSRIVAAERNEEKKNYHVNLELSQNDMFIGRTYVELRENAVDSFLLNEDIYMLRNGVNADIFTNAGGYEAAANVLPIANHIVPVGLYVKKAGTYTFSMPDNFDGEVILVDTYTQTRTNLAMDDYEIALSTGEISDRFLLEINISNTPTAIDGVGDGSGNLKDGKAHKFIMNDQMYILQNGIIYDARGARVK